MVKVIDGRSFQRHDDEKNLQPCDLCNDTKHEAKNCHKNDSETQICSRCGHLHAKPNCFWYQPGVEVSRDDTYYFTPSVGERARRWMDSNRESEVEKAEPSTKALTSVVSRPHPNNQVVPAQGPSANQTPSTSTKAASKPKTNEEVLRAIARKKEIEQKMRDSPQHEIAYDKPLHPVRPPAKPMEVLANFFEVTMDAEKVLYKYQVSLGFIRRGRPINKRETKKAMIQSLMDHITSSQPNLKWVSDFNEIVLTESEISGHPNVEDGQRSYDHKRRTETPGIFADIQSDLIFKETMRVRDLMQYCQRNSSFAVAMDILTMLNIISWKNVHDNPIVGQVGKKFYPPTPGQLVAVQMPQGRARPGKNLKWFVVEKDAFEGRLGFYTSMRAGDGKVFMNMNTTTSVFFAPVTLDKWLDSSCQNPIIHPRNRIDELLSMKVQIASTEPNVRIIREIKQGSHHLTIKRIPGQEDDEEDTDEKEPIEDHLKARKRWPQPALKGKMNIGTRDTPEWKDATWINNPDYTRMRYVNVGNEQHPDWYPIYQATLKPFQPYRSQVTSDIMVNAAQRSPLENQTHILNALQTLGVTVANPPPPQWRVNSNLNCFSIQDIAQNFVRCPARQITPPKIYYRSRDQKVFKGGWSNMNQKLMHVQGNYQHMHCIEITLDAEPEGLDGRLTAGLELLWGNLKESGITTVSTSSIIQTRVNFPTPFTRDQFRSAMNNAVMRLQQTRRPMPIILVIIPRKDLDLYADIKWWGDCVQGVPTICVQRSKLLPSLKYDKVAKKEREFPVDGKTLGNLSLKFNFKLGGTNHYHSKNGDWVKRFDKTMIMGADVTHPKSNSHCPSIAGVVATCSVKPVASSHYLGSVRLQESRMEHISDLKEMVAERVLKWHNTNKALPENILFYRDGVSETQFEKVKTLEFTQIRDGFKLAAAEVKKCAVDDIKDDSIKITLLVVGKRHHTRFYPVGNKDPKTDNCPEGTVVDSVILDPNHFSFYLQSHYSELGTARSAHYFVMRNEMRLNSQELQDFTMKLCYMTSKSVKALSVCPPARYADLLCERARCYMRPALMNATGYNAHRSTNSYQADILAYGRETRTWRSAHNQPGSGRTNPWSPHLDSLMFYL